MCARLAMQGPVSARSAALNVRLVGLQPTVIALSNLLSARSLLSHSIEDAARDGPCVHGNHRFARAAPADPRAKRNDDSKNRGRASPVNVRQGPLGVLPKAT